MDNLGDLIAYYRIQAKLTQEQLSKLVGVSASTIGSYEQSYAIPSLQVFNKLCKELSVRPDVLLNYNSINNFQPNSNSNKGKGKDKLDHLTVYKDLRYVDNKIIGAKYSRLAFPTADFAIIMNDSTMSNTIKKDDILIVKSISPTNDKGTLSQYINKIVIANKKQRTLIRKLSIKDNNLYLHATNSNYNNIAITDDTLIIGVALQVLKIC